MDYEKLRDGYIPCCDEDKFEFRKLAGFIPEILHDYKKPITIGIYGKIGSGKSTLLSMIEEKLGKPIIRFEAWKYHEPETLWRSFLYEIGKKLPEKNRREIMASLDDLYSEQEYYLFKRIDKVALFF